MTSDPVPDELCPHVALGAEMTGGWYFAAENPPKAVGMCHECIEWCRLHFDSGVSWSDYVETMAAEAFAERAWSGNS